MMAEPLTATATLEEAARRVRETGVVTIETDNGPVWVVSPTGRGNDAPDPFDPETEELRETPLKRAAYSDRTAWLMAVMSQLAYLPYERDKKALSDLQLTLADTGMQFVEFLDDSKTGTQGFLARKPGEFIILAFRGTEKSFKDIMSDLNARFLETSDGKAHKGFLTAYENVKKSVMEELDKLPSDEPLYITGHSLGGALASVAARDISTTHLVAACYTYGSPRVGTVEWSDATKVPVYRVVNEADGVPMVPGNIALQWVLQKVPLIPLLGWLRGPCDRIIKTGWVGYQHVGDDRFLQGTIDVAVLKKGSAALLPRYKAVLISPIGGFFRALWKGSFKIRNFSGYFMDHAINQYVGKLRRIALDRN